MIGHRRSRSRMLWVALALTGVTVLQAQSPPPVHLEGDHWTAWNPPVPPEGAQVHIIQSGDTLWGIATSLLGDPYLWPQIWEQNSYILDSHWIYPGDPLMVSSTAGQEMADAEGVVARPLEDGLADGAEVDDPFASVLEGNDGSGSGWQDSFGDSSISNIPIPLGAEADIYCSGYIGSLDEEFPYRVGSSEYEFLTPTLDPQRDSEIKGLYGKTDTQKLNLSSGDIVYLDSGRADGLAAGELLMALAPGRLVKHPLNGNVIGRFNRYLGRVRILSVQEQTAIAEIVRACHPLSVGVALKLFEPEPVPLRRMSPPRPLNYPAKNEELEDAPTIVKAFDDIVTMGRGYLVYIDQGEAQDVLPGDVFTIYRRARRGYPPVVLGELAILSVQENTALGNILNARYTIHIGDAVLIK